MTTTNRHPFSPIGDSPYCAYVRGVNDDGVCGETERAAIHLSDDIVDDRCAPFNRVAQPSREVPQHDHDPLYEVATKIEKWFTERRILGGNAPFLVAELRAALAQHDHDQESGKEAKNSGVPSGQIPKDNLLSAVPPFTTLAQEFYKDDDGHDIAASEVEFLAPYLHVCDGFYKWECGRCGREHQSRSCGWPIAGQTLKCDGCGTLNLLVKTNTVQLDELVGKKNDLDLGLMRLASDRATFDTEVKRAADNRLRLLKAPLQALLREIESTQDTNTASGTTDRDTTKE